MTKQWLHDAPRRRQILRIGLCVHMVLWGLIYLFGPARVRSSPSLVWIASFAVPIQVWGAVAVVIGVFLLTKWRMYAHGIAHVFWSFWALCSLAAVFSVERAAGSGWLHVVWIAVSHLQFALYEDDDPATLDFAVWKSR